MRVGVTILPDLPWSQAGPMWRRAEELGFDHAFTYDHITWGGLPDAPWFGTTPTLTAAALVTTTMRLGTFVTSPNYRHPVSFMRDLLSLDDVSRGRIICGLGTGGDLDSSLLGGPQLSVRERVDRFEEFVSLLDRLLTDDHVDADGTYFTARGVRTLPGPVQQPRIPFLIAANGPRSLRLVARYGQAWVTTGPRVDTLEQWWSAVHELSLRLHEILVDGGREPASVDRYLSIDSSPVFSYSSLDAFEELAGRAAQCGFTDLVTHWPRPDGPYAGDVAVMERVAAEVLPGLR